MLPLLTKTVRHTISTSDSFLPRRAHVLGGRRAPGLAIAVAIFVTSAAVVVPLNVAQLGLRLNLSRSMPRGLYRMTVGPIDRGALVAFCLDPARAALGRERGYLGVGSCASGVEPLLKRVVAVVGDVLDHERDFVAVNGRRLAESATLAADPQGRALAHGAFGISTIPLGSVWVFSAAPLGWDSRYFGAVPEAGILGLAEPLLTEGGD